MSSDLPDSCTNRSALFTALTQLLRAWAKGDAGALEQLTPRRSGKYAVVTTPTYGYVGPPKLFSSITTTPAKPGDHIILWGTGFGPTKPSVPAGVVPSTVIPSGQIANLADSVTVLIGNVSAKVISAALSPDSAGLYQIAVQVPASTPSGDQPVVAQVAGLYSPSGVYISVQQ